MSCKLKNPYSKKIRVKSNVDRGKENGFKYYIPNKNEDKNNH